MASDVDIANLALVMIGAQRIGALTENSKNARELNAIYVSYRESELRAHNWSFAINRVVLPALATAPPFGFQWYYQLPPDFLKLIQAGGFSPGLSLTDYRSFNEQAYAIEGDKIAWGSIGPVHQYGVPLAQVSPPNPVPLKVRYIRRITDPTKFDSLFVTAFAARLALQVCEKITGSSDKDKNAAQMYQQAIADALRSNAIEKPPSPMMDDSWVMTRNF